MYQKFDYKYASCNTTIKRIYTSHNIIFNKSSIDTDINNCPFFELSCSFKEKQNKLTNIFLNEINELENRFKTYSE